MEGETPPLVLVDAENVRRSVWPNLSPERLVELLRAWADEHGRDVLVVFDGQPHGEPSGRIRVVGSGAESADDVIAAESERLDRFWLVTSDRELRGRSGGAAERT